MHADKAAVATENQMRANRQNALKSTGPRTAEGKSKVAFNALKHGLLADRVVLPTEDEDEFGGFRFGLEQKLEPVGELEELLVDTIAADAWRLRRLLLVEKGLFLQYVYEVAERKSRGIVHDEGSLVDRTVRDVWDFAGPLAREIGGDYEKAVTKAVTLAEQAEARARSARERTDEAVAIRTSPDALLGQAFIEDAEQGTHAFSRLARYEAHIQRSMFKALDELQRLQATRKQEEPAAESETPATGELETTNGDKPS